MATTNFTDQVTIIEADWLNVADALIYDVFAGAATASAARTALGTAIGSDVQAYDAGLADVAGLTPTDGNFIVGDGANWVAESGATARTSLGIAADVITTRGDVIRGDSGGSAERLAVGTAGYVLGSDGTDAAWVAPEWEFVDTSSPSAASSVDFTDFAADYDYIFSCEEIIPAADDWFVMKIHEGGSFVSDSNCRWSQTRAGSTEGTVLADHTDDGSYDDLFPLGFNNTESTGVGHFAQVEVIAPRDTDRPTSIFVRSVTQDTANAVTIYTMYGNRATSASNTGIQFLFNAGQTFSGFIKRYRRRRT